MPNLVADVAAVVAAEGADKATIVGHDWGGAVAWQVAFALPEMVENLVIMNLPHPNGFARELANNEEQQRNRTMHNVSLPVALMIRPSLVVTP